MFFGGVTSSLATLKNSGPDFTLLQATCPPISLVVSRIVYSFFFFFPPNAENPSNRRSPRKSVENKCAPHRSTMLTICQRLCDVLRENVAANFNFRVDAAARRNRRHRFSDQQRFPNTRRGDKKKKHTTCENPEHTPRSVSRPRHHRTASSRSSIIRLREI